MIGAGYTYQLFMRILLVYIIYGFILRVLFSLFLIFEKKNFGVERDK